MREIKFRIFDIKNNHLYEPNDSFLIAISGQIYNNDGGNVTDGFNLIQNTGFKDKTYRDIYEGDILSAYTKVDGKILKSYNQVFWNEYTGSWHLDNSYNQDKTNSTELWLELNDFKYEISGNIYQNPELLQSTKDIEVKAEVVKGCPFDEDLHNN